jgi:hypothetical protein
MILQIFTWGIAVAAGYIYVVDPINGPYLNIQSAIDAKWGGLVEGDEVHIAAGTYRETVRVQGRGTESNPVIVRAADGAEGLVFNIRIGSVQL